MAMAMARRVFRRGRISFQGQALSWIWDVSSAPFLYGGVVYVGTFIARTRKPGTQELCGAQGDGKLYALDPITGASKWKSGQQALLFANIKIVGISASKDGNLFIGVKVLQPRAMEALRRYEDLRGFKSLVRNTVIQTRSIASDTVLNIDLERNVPHLQYWREFF